MNSQTARRPDSKRPTRSTKASRYTKQTAHVAARRDGKPLIFGWGGHLSRNEKNTIQRRAIWTLTIGVAVLIVVVLVGFWVNVNIIAPAQPITTVNGHGIPLADYRKLLDVKAQIEENKIQGKNGLDSQRDALNRQVAAQQTIVDSDTTKLTALEAQIKALPAGTDKTSQETQLTTLKQQLVDDKQKHDTLAAQYSNLTTNTIPLEQELYTQPQQTSETATWLQDDELIREWLQTQNSSVNAQVNPSSSVIDSAVKTFAANFPVGSSYQKFLSTNSLSDNDVRSALALTIRRTNMQTYLASQVVSPTYQVLARGISLSTPADANSVLKQLKAGADFTKLVKAKSVDTQTNTKGGEFGWMARGQYIQTYAANTSGVVENWLFAPGRSIDELSPVLIENGTYHIVQILGIDPSRAVDSTTLASLKTNALNNWLMSRRASSTVTAVNQDMITDSSIMPSGLPATSPGQAVPTTTGGAVSP